MVGETKVKHRQVGPANYEHHKGRVRRKTDPRNITEGCPERRSGDRSTVTEVQPIFRPRVKKHVRRACGSRELNSVVQGKRGKGELLRSGWSWTPGINDAVP